MYSQERGKITTTKCWSPSVFIDTQCANINFFQIKGRTIKHVGNYWGGTKLLGRTPIAAKTHFSVKVAKTVIRNIRYGVVGSKLRTDGSKDWNEENVILYYGLGGAVWENKKGFIKQEGSGVKQGQTVTVRVDQEKGEIRWEVDGKTETRYEMEELKDKQIEWVPYIWFFSTGDTCEWIE